jgi:class 3 adenylate cyclase
MPDIPSGTVTFLFTDIEGSTRLLGQFPRAYPAALMRHDALLRQAVESHSGWVFETVGDAFYAAFARPSDAVAAAIDAQRALLHEQWGELQAIKVRMGLHTGEVEVRGQHYFGTALYRCARLMAIGHGGQTLVSDATAQLVRDSVANLQGLLGEAALEAARAEGRAMAGKDAVAYALADPVLVPSHTSR